MSLIQKIRHTSSATKRSMCVLEDKLNSSTVIVSDIKQKSTGKKSQNTITEDGNYK